MGDVEMNMGSRKVVKPNFTTDYYRAMAREGADEPTLRAEEEGMLRTFIDTTDVGDDREPPLVNEGCRAICQAIFQGVEGSEWVTMYNNHKELHKSVKCKKSGEDKKAKALLVKEKDTRQRKRSSHSKMIPSEVGLLGNPLEEPDGCFGRRIVQSNNVGRPIISNKIGIDCQRSCGTWFDPEESS